MTRTTSLWAVLVTSFVLALSALAPGCVYRARGRATVYAPGPPPPPSGVVVVHGPGHHHHHHHHHHGARVRVHVHP